MHTTRITPINSADPNPNFRIVEIFSSLQGEGYNTGMPATFVRLGRCNLTCPWCDTDYLSFEPMSLEEIVQRCQNYATKNIIITGGEPVIHPNLSVLLDRLKQEGYKLHVETNGLQAVQPQFDYIATSPKAMYAEKYTNMPLTYADEVRIVADADVIEFCQLIETKVQARNFYLSPCEINGKMNILETISQIGTLNQRPHKPSQPHWQLSIQTHKLAGIE